jgi:hypothetical protein
MSEGGTKREAELDAWIQFGGGEHIEKKDGKSEGLVQSDNDKARPSQRAGRAESVWWMRLTANRVNAFAVIALSGFDLQTHLLA